MKKSLLALFLTLVLAPAASYAQVVVRIGPPPVVVEHPGPPPASGYVWLGGYQRWNGSQFVWVPGHYERPPHAGAYWVRHHWVHRRRGWVFVRGHWR